MCGIAGEACFDFSASSPDLSAVARMADVLAPRGPDAAGAWQQDRFALAHRRLRIIDLSEHAHTTFFGLLLALLLATTAATASAEMVSIRGATVNMRASPGTNAEILWELGRHYPLRVVERRGGWLKVRDFEGDEGWVFARLTARTPTMIVKRPTANIRSGPGTGYRILGRAEYGEAFRTLERRGRWVRVAVPPDNRDGWIARSLLWGW